MAQHGFSLLDATTHSKEEEPLSISGKSRAIRARLETVQTAATQTSVPSSLTPAVLEDFRDQFALWIGNMGALHKPTAKLSLEHRLSDAHGVLRHVHRLLDDLLSVVEEISSILSRWRPRPVDGVDCTNDRNTTPPHEPEEKQEELEEELEFLGDEISDSLRGLFRIGVLVRRAVSRDRFAHAIRTSQAKFSEHFDIDYVRQKFPKLARSGKDADWLLRRLGKANCRRRQVQKYYRDHKFRLAAGEGYDDGDENETRNKSSMATPFRADRLGNRRSTGASVVSFHTFASGAMTAITTFNKADILALPRPAQRRWDDEPAECPICFVLCSFSSEKAWKSHAYSDIRPYVCTLGGPDCEDLMFADRNSWASHELSQHRSHFTCAICAAADFDSEALFREHIAGHEGCTGERVDDLLTAGRKVQRSFTAADCPFCDEWEAARIQSCGSAAVTGLQLKRHVATHLEQLAIFAIPRAAGDFAKDKSSAGPDASLSNQRNNSDVLRETSSIESEDAGDGSEPEGITDARELSAPGTRDDTGLNLRASATAVEESRDDPPPPSGQPTVDDGSTNNTNDLAIITPQMGNIMRLGLQETMAGFQQTAAMGQGREAVDQRGQRSNSNGETTDGHVVDPSPVLKRIIEDWIGRVFQEAGLEEGSDISQNLP